ncbi:hypothetical protein ACOME3_008080 [Neoechinorhynchus agilis]
MHTYDPYYMFILLYVPIISMFKTGNPENAEDLFKLFSDPPESNGQIRQIEIARKPQTKVQIPPPIEGQLYKFRSHGYRSIIARDSDVLLKLNFYKELLKLSKLLPTKCPVILELTAGHRQELDPFFDDYQSEAVLKTGQAARFILRRKDGSIICNQGCFYKQFNFLDLHSEIACIEYLLLKNKLRIRRYRDLLVFNRDIL